MPMRKIALLCVFGFSVGCAQVGVVSFENHQEGQIFKLCGNRWAKTEDFERAAIKQCNGGFKLLAGGIENGGYTAYTSYGNGAAYTTGGPIGVPCMTYQCR